MTSCLALIVLVALIEALHGECPLGRNRLELGAAFQFEAGEDGLHALFLRELLVLVVHLQTRQRIFLAWRVVGATGAVLVLKEDANAHFFAMGEVVQCLIVLPHTYRSRKRDLTREHLLRLVGRAGRSVATNHFQLFAADWSPGNECALIGIVECSCAEAHILRDELVVNDLARLHHLLLLGSRVELHLACVEVSEARTVSEAKSVN